MTKIKAGIIGAVIVAGVASPLIIYHQAQENLRDKDAVLRQQNDQLTQLMSENARLSNLVAHADASLDQGQSRELLKLRGEVGLLKRQMAEAQILQERTKRATQVKTEADRMEEQKQISIAKMNYTKGWMMAFWQYAEKNQGLIPTNFEQAVSFLPDETKNETNLVTDQFEITYQGSLKEITNPASIIVLREKDIVQDPDGGAHRAYGFADGHSEIHKAVDGNFQPWEQQHMVAPPLASTPGQ